ncbi:MAG TPA: helix-turn-helix domain-containing protein [Chitinophagaceae bacterium]|nr:helix-turn-helix domain-containing protein [Chitinophagaceae bacterium]
MDSHALQQALLRTIRENLPTHLSAADEIARILEISTDSAYRRLRGEKSLSLDELLRLCAHFHISLDQLTDNQTGAFVFRGNLIDPATFRFDAYVQGMIRDLTYFNGFAQREIYYLCKDIPIFHHYLFREIAAFKRFFWLKTYLQFPEYRDRRFRFEDYPDSLFRQEMQVLELYNRMTSYELWNVESMNILIRQIEFYRNSQVFESDRDALTLYQLAGQLIDHLEAQAALGFKFAYGDPERTPLGAFHMYFNEVFLGDNNILVILDGVKMSLLTHTTVNYMATRDLAFNENMYRHISNLMKRSTLISSVSERERSRFFRILKEKIQHRREALGG